ncbi:Uncharacterised protein [Mycobacterium tuberculosis]|nr:Uncharacterised protein [Mycobacterium tuberculosis]
MDTSATPLLSVVRGAPTDEELAALVVALLTVTRERAGPGAALGPEPTRRSPRWALRPAYLPPRAWTSR